jgi:hypothetical protein
MYMQRSFFSSQLRVMRSVLLLMVMMATLLASLTLAGPGKVAQATSLQPNWLSGRLTSQKFAGSTKQASAGIEVGSQPSTVVMGDFNKDGKQDLATANPGVNAVSILLGNGDGTFSPATTYTVGNSPYAVMEGDFNKDGKLDLVAANYNDNTVSVLLGKGDGTFAPATTYAVGASPISMAVGDFNKDGKPDLAVANYNGNTVSVLLGKGNGTFAPATNIAGGSLPNRWR